jgi:hypothetical protein
MRECILRKLMQPASQAEPNPLQPSTAKRKVGEFNSDRTPKRRKMDHTEARLSISASTFSEESARRIIDDWLVPVLVEKFIRGREISTKSEEGKA